METRVLILTALSQDHRDQLGRLFMAQDHPAMVTNWNRNPVHEHGSVSAHGSNAFKKENHTKTLYKLETALLK